MTVKRHWPYFSDIMLYIKYSLETNKLSLLYSLRRLERTIHFTIFLNIVKLWFYLTAAGFEPSLYHWKSPASRANAQAIELRAISDLKILVRLLRGILCLLHLIFVNSVIHYATPLTKSLVNKNELNVSIHKKIFKNSKLHLYIFQYDRKRLSV